MRVFQRILGALGLLLGVIGFLLSLVVGVGVWVVREPVTTRATQIFGRVDAGLDLAENGLDHARQSLTRAGERLDHVKDQWRKLAREPKKDDPSRKLIARTVQKHIGPELDDARQKIQTVAAAAVVVNSVLDDLGSFPDLSVTGFDTGRLAEMNDRLAKVGPAAWELSRLLGEAEPDADADAQVSRVELILRTLLEWIAEYQTQVRQVRQRTTEVKTRMLSRITPAALLISLVFFWIALSQTSILAQAWSWFKPSDRDRPGSGRELPTSSS